jgi:hypothetical protein
MQPSAATLHTVAALKNSQLLQAVFNTIACKHNNLSAAGIAKVIGHCKQNQQQIK